MKFTAIKLIKFGIISLNTICHVGSPNAFAASTNSLCFSESTCDLMLLASPVHAVTLSINPITHGSVALMSVANTMSKGSPGIVIITSVIPMSIMSANPPRNPATMPTVTPITVVMSPAMKAICSTVLEPHTILAQISAPK